MSSPLETYLPSYSPVNQTVQEQARWFAVQTRGKHEKKVAGKLMEKGVETYLPLLREIHKWSDRKKMVEVPLFPCYTFVQIAPLSAARLQVLQTDGVVRIVGMGSELAPVDPKQIEDVRLLLSQNVSLTLHPFLKIGQRVRVRGGSLEGLEGILVSRQNASTLVVSVDTIQRSIAISADGYDIQPV